MTGTDEDIDALLARIDTKVRNFEGERREWDAACEAAEQRAARYRTLAQRGPDDPAGWLVSGMVAPYRSWGADAGTDRGDRQGSWLSPHCFGESAAVGLPLVWDHDQAIVLGEAVNVRSFDDGLNMRFAVRATAFAARLFEGNDRRRGLESAPHVLQFSVTYRRTDGGERRGPNSEYLDEAELLNVSLVPAGNFRTWAYGVELVYTDDWDETLAEMREATTRATAYRSESPWPHWRSE